MANAPVPYCDDVPTTRVFRMEDWIQDSQSSVNSPRVPYETSAYHPKPSMSAMPFRKRLQSLPLVGELSRDVQHMSVTSTGNPSLGDGNRLSGIRGLFRKASVSLKSRQRRHSHVVEEERPQTAWNRLRTAASFNRHSKLLPPAFDIDVEGPYDSHEELHSPIPGNGRAPPIIPRGSGGAARATAAAQNEYFGFNRNLQFLLADEQQGDRESGIGIAVSVPDQADTIQFQDSSFISNISRIDFISRLPTELATHILAQLDPDTLINIPFVSHRWNQISRTPHIWHEVFLREETRTYATSSPVALGAGLGLPALTPNNDWKELYRIRQQLKRNWLAGKAEPVYLNGHLDSIYCVQFDE